MENKKYNNLGEYFTDQELPTENCDIKLTEATAGEKFSQEEPETKKGESITDILDRCASQAEEFYEIMGDIIAAGTNLPGAVQTNTYNPLFVGPTGAGKTSIIKTWARDNGYEVITLNMMGDALDFLGVKTINRDYDLQIDDEGNTKKVARVSTVATQAFDPFLHGKTKILFLDEINKTNPTILQSLYDLIAFHTVQNGDDVMYLPKLLFTVGAMNPSDYGGGREELDPALKARMQVYEVNYDTVGLKKFLCGTYDEFIKVCEKRLEDAYKQKKENGESEELTKIINRWEKAYSEWCGRKDLVEKLLADPKKFHWTDAEKISKITKDTETVLVPRTFEVAIRACDGTKADCLSKIKNICGVEAAAMCNNLLAGYQDKDHIANKVWDKDYSVKKEEKPEEVSAEDQILNQASEEEKSENKVNTNLYRKLQDRMRNRE